MRKLYATLLLCTSAYFANAQFTTYSNPANPGVTSVVTPAYTEFRLTTTSPIEQSGAVWRDAQYSLLSDFTVNVQLNFGQFSEANPDLSKEQSRFNFTTGADGIVFVLSPVKYLGEHGEEIGYGTTVANTGVYTPNNSLGIEMDTWENTRPGFDGFRNHFDPSADHLAIMSKGNTHHNSADQLVAPIAFPAEIEDGQWHDVTITWVAATRTITLTFASPAIAISRSLTPAEMTAIFGGATDVNAGFTAGTGTAANEHRVRWMTPPPPPTDCLPGRTQTIGGWGAEPSGNNPGTYLHGNNGQNFLNAFPGGLVVGAGANTVTFTTAQAITNYLPAGGPSVALTQSYNNPSTNALKNTLVSQLVAVTLSVGFDNYDPNFSPSSVTLGQMIIGSGPFAGMTVNAFLAAANSALSGAASMYTLAQFNQTATWINENYVDGNRDNGFLDCPTVTTSRNAPVLPQSELTDAVAPVQNGVIAYPNPSRGQVQVNIGSLKNAQIMVVNSRGVIVERRAGISAQTTALELKKYGTGVYLVKVISGSNVQTLKVLIQD